MIFADLIQTASSLPTDASALESSISALESAISALESEVKTLESSSVPWEYLVWIFTFLVVVGVVMDFWVIRHEYRDDMDAWAWSHFGIFFPGRPSAEKFAIEIASVLFIAFGVAGELGAGIKITAINGKLRGKSAELRSKNSELRSKSDQLLALVTQEAGDAGKSAGEAHGLGIDLLAKYRAAETELAAAKERVVTLEKQLEWRELSPAQAQAIHDAISPFAGTKFTLGFQGGDAETELYANDFLTVLTNSGWILSEPPNAIFGSRALVGLALSVKDVHNSPAAVLQKALGDLHIPVDGKLEEGLPDGIVKLTIGVKPRPIRTKTANASQ